MEFTLQSEAEQTMDSAFLQLQQAASGLIAQLAASVQNSNTRVLVANIQEYMGSIRAGIRDLEEFADEQDRYRAAPHRTYKAACSTSVCRDKGTTSCKFGTLCRIDDTERLIMKVSQRRKAYESLQVDLRRANLQV